VSAQKEDTMTPARARSIPERVANVRALLVVAEASCDDRTVAGALTIAISELGRLESEVEDLADSHAEAIGAVVTLTKEAPHA